MLFMATEERYKVLWKVYKEENWTDLLCSGVRGTIVSLKQWQLKLQSEGWLGFRWRSWENRGQRVLRKKRQCAKVHIEPEKVLDLQEHWLGLELEKAKFYLFFWIKSNTTDFLTSFKLIYISSTLYKIKPKILFFFLLVFLSIATFINPIFVIIIVIVPCF